MRGWPSAAGGARDEAIRKLTVVVLSEQLGPLPEIVPPLPPGSETIRMQELVSQPSKASGKSNVIRKTLRDGLIERLGEFAGRMGRPR